jgi:hypothetical protein
MPSRHRVPHQLIIRLDQHANGSVEIRWDYPFSTPPIPEQHIPMGESASVSQLSRDVEKMRKFMIGKLPPAESVRVPHGYIKPERRFDVLTIVIQDKWRDLPVVRLYYTEIYPGGATVDDKEVRIDGRGNTSRVESDLWDSIHKTVCGIVWKDYQARFRPEFP